MREKNGIYYGAAGILWLIIWQFVAVRIDNEIFLPSPKAVWEALLKLIRQENFYLSVMNSFFHVLEGFCLAAVMGTLLAVLSHISKKIRIFLTIPLKMMQAAPVASFTILALVWLPSKRLPVLVSFLMVLPTMKIHIEQGITGISQELLEMSSLYRMPFIKKMQYLYIPYTLPYFLSACSLGMGMAWKSGIAAEVIGITKNSIGNQLYQAKLYLMIPELFAWTLVIIFGSMILEKLVLISIRKLQEVLK